MRWKARIKVLSHRPNFGIDYIASSEKENIYCTQFHPEKSGNAGHKLIKNFLNLKKKT